LQRRSGIEIENVCLFGNVFGILPSLVLGQELGFVLKLQRKGKRRTVYLKTDARAIKSCGKVDSLSLSLSLSCFSVAAGFVHSFATWLFSS
jgi:hypothetical protein